MSKKSTLAFVAAVNADGSLGAPLSRDVAGMVAHPKPSPKAKAKTEGALDALAMGGTTEPQVPFRVRARISLVNAIASGAATDVRRDHSLAQYAAETFRYLLSQSGCNTLPDGKLDTWTGEAGERARELLANERALFREAIKDETTRKVLAANKQVGYGSQLAKADAERKGKAKAATYTARFTDAVYAVRDGMRDAVTGEPIARDGEASTGQKAKATREHKKAEIEKFGKLPASWREHYRAMCNAYAGADKADIAKVNGSGAYDALIELGEALGFKAD